MNCWEILGIEATSDLAAIKTAYAAKAKEWHPEEYPEEFKQLQQAYRAASRLAKMQKGNAGFAAAEELTETAIVKEEQTAENEEGKEEEEQGEQEVRQRFDYESVEEADYYDYKEALERDLNDQFFTEFFAVAWNPYLMNNLVCWEFVLKSSPYDELLSSNTFRYNFVRTVCYSLSGWKRETILFFEKWLQSRAADGETQEKKKETELFCWRLRKINLLGNVVSVRRCVTREQKELHEIFLAQVRRSGGDTSLTDKADVECYLSFYLPYAVGKKSAVKEMYDESGQGRAFLLGVLCFIMLIIGMIIYNNVCIAPDQNAAKREEAIQQRIEQRADEIRKYNEMLQEEDSGGTEWIQKYNEELRQEFLKNNAELFREYYEDFPDSETIADVMSEIEEMEIDGFEDMTAEGAE